MIKASIIVGLLCLVSNFDARAVTPDPLLEAAQLAGQLSDMAQPPSVDCDVEDNAPVGPAKKTPEGHAYPVAVISNVSRSNLRQCLLDKRTSDGKWYQITLNNKEICGYKEKIVMDQDVIVNGNGLMETSGRAYKTREAITHGTTSTLRIGKRNGRMKVSLGMSFTNEDPPPLREKTLAKFEKYLLCALNFYRGYGIDISFDRTIPNSKNMKFSSKKFRSNSARVSLDDLPDVACGVIVHELGHNLGLPDRYSDKECRERKMIGAFNNVMRYGGVLPVQKLALYPADMNIIAFPLCSDLLAQKKSEPGILGRLFSR